MKEMMFKSKQHNSQYSLTQKLFVLLLSILVVAMVVYLFGDGISGNDFWWHVKVGEYVVSTNSVPTHDVFSWVGIEKGIPWTAHEWLSDVFFYHLYSAFGETGIFVFSFALAILLVGLLWNEAKNFSKTNLPLTGLFFILLSPVLCSFFYGRPHVFSFFLLFAELKVLFSWHQKRDKRIFIIPFLSVLWSNLHGGSSSLSYLLCALFLIAGVFEVKTGKISNNKYSKKDILELSLTTLLAVLALLLNPIGSKVIVYPFQNLSDKISMAMISEWQPPDAKNIGAVILYFVPMLLMFVGFISTEKRIDMIDIVIMLFFVFCFLRSVRFIILWYIASVFCAFKYVPKCDIKEIKRRWERIILGLSIATAIVLLVICSVRFAKKIRNGNLIQTVLSEEAISVIKTDAAMRIFNDYNFGEALIFNDIKTFFDARADLFAAENIMRDGMSLTYLSPMHDENTNEFSVESIISKYDFDAFVTLKTRPLFAYLSSQPQNYRLIYEDEDMAYFKRLS